MKFTIGGIEFDFSFTIFVMPYLFYLSGETYLSSGPLKDNVAAMQVIPIVTTCLIFLSIICHETAHAVVLGAFGIKVKSVGAWALGAWVRPEKDLRETNPKTMFLVAFAGPAVNFVLAGLAIAVLVFTNEPYAEEVLRYFVYINIILALFNLVPTLITDGGYVVSAILWKSRVATYVKAIGSVLLIWKMIDGGMGQVFDVIEVWSRSIV